MKTHRLKIWPQWFDAVRRGVKSYEIRKDDRNFNVGDDVMLEEFNPAVSERSGRILHRRIVYISRGEDAEAFGLRDGYCVLGLEKESAAAKCG
jgi:Domain of unknown function (DUF3850)